MTGFHPINQSQTAFLLCARIQPMLQSKLPLDPHLQSPTRTYSPSPLQGPSAPSRQCLQLTSAVSYSPKRQPTSEWVPPGTFYSADDTSSLTVVSERYCRAWWWSWSLLFMDQHTVLWGVCPLSMDFILAPELYEKSPNGRWYESTDRAVEQHSHKYDDCGCS